MLFPSPRGNFVVFLGRKVVNMSIVTTHASVAATSASMSTTNQASMATNQTSVATSQTSVTTYDQALVATNQTSVATTTTWVSISQASVAANASMNHTEQTPVRRGKGDAGHAEALLRCDPLACPPPSSAVRASSAPGRGVTRMRPTAT